jgi:glucoselysine-6-phosphate deglycase
MYDCYLSQFDCLARLLESRESLLSGFADYYAGVNPDRLYLVGSGTSFHACSAAAYYMEGLLGIEITVAAATAMTKPYGKRPLVIAVSQSGLSTNTRDMVGRLVSLGVPVISLTDPKITPVSSAADFPILLQADNEKIGPKTRGYMATVLTLYLMALEVSKIERERYDSEIAELRAVIGMGPRYLEACGSFFENHREELSKARSYMFAGKGAAGKAAAECALKILETVCYPAMGYEYEEFLHGPAFSADERLALFLFLCDDEDKERMLKSSELVGNATENSYIISHDESVQGDKILFLPTACPDVMSPFTDVLIGQLISSVLPETIGRGRHPAVKDFLSDMDTKVKQGRPSRPDE